jgi:hypothetical protein
VAEVIVERVTKGDLEVVRVCNDVLALSFLPEVGGRLISLEVAGAELLWRNPAWLTGDLSPTTPHQEWPTPDETMGSWANVGGSKTWPAPQGWEGADQWPGPPDPVLDAGAYALEITARPDAVLICLTSEDDRRTGLCIRREFRVPAHGDSFSHVATLTNTSARRVRWSAWEVTQVATALGGEIVVDVDSHEVPLTLLAAHGTPDSTTEAGRSHIPVLDVVAKLGFPHATGRVSWLRSDGARLAQEMRRENGAVYPDGGCPVELWLQHPMPAPLEELGGLQPDAHLVELETLSPLRDLEPGESTRHVVTWRCSAPPAKGSSQPIGGGGERVHAGAPF